MRGDLWNFPRNPRFLMLATGIAIGVSGCAYEKSLRAERAKTSLVGMPELDLETCLGLPDKEATKGKTTLLSYNATSARTVNLSIPIVNGVGVSIAGTCRATFRLENGRVASVSIPATAIRSKVKTALAAPLCLPFPARLGRSSDGRLAWLDGTA
jgi:hypothetical protein